MGPDSLDIGIVSPSEKSRNRYFSVSLCNPFKVSGVNDNAGEKPHQEERFHLVLVPHWDFVDVDDGSIPTAWDAAVRLNRTEYRPAMLAIALVPRETERDEQRLNCLWPVVFVQSAIFARAWEEEAHRSMYRASYGGNSPTLRAMPGR